MTFNVFSKRFDVEFSKDRATRLSRCSKMQNVEGSMKLKTKMRNDIDIAVIVSGVAND